MIDLLKEDYDFSVRFNSFLESWSIGVLELTKNATGYFATKTLRHTLKGLKK
jgi:hypothetical protein